MRAAEDRTGSGPVNGMRRISVVVLGVVVAGIAFAVSPASACYCDSVPFPKAVASADVVVIGRVLDRVTKETDPTKRATGPDRYWTSRVQVERVIKGKPVDPFVVGGFWSSCDGGSAAEVGHTYAFAFQEKVKLSLGFYWMTLCSESSAEVRKGGSRTG